MRCSIKSLDDSGLYQALYRLEDTRLVSAECGMTANNRRARYYRLTSAGRTHLRRETGMWLRYSTLIVLAGSTRNA